MPKCEALPKVIGHENEKERDRRLTELVPWCTAYRKCPLIERVNCRRQFRSRGWELASLLVMVKALIIDTPELGTCDGALKILGDCTSRLFSDAAELSRTPLCRGLCATAVK